MAFRDDDRAQSVQVGAILLFASLVIFASLYQATAIPSQNSQIEFDDYMTASSDMTKLRNAVLDTASSNAEHGVNVKAGTRYPARVFFVNPPPATGRVTTTAASNATLRNATASASGDLREFWAGGTHNFTTRSIVFQPGYHEIDAAPVTTAYGFTYRSYESPVKLASQSLVQGNRITLVTVAGGLSASGTSPTITTTPLSAHTQTITVKSTSTEPLTLVVPTKLSAAQWENKVLSGQHDPSGDGTDEPSQYVQAVEPGPRNGTVKLTFESGPNKTYELKLAKIGVSEASDELTVSDPKPTYVVPVKGENTTAVEGQNQTLAVEVRDRFNNPKSNVDVAFTTSDGTFSNGKSTINVTTNARGKATVSFTPGHAGSVAVHAEMKNHGSNPLNETTINLTAVPSAKGANPLTNPNNTVVLAEARQVYAGSAYTLEMELKNRADKSLSISKARLAFYYAPTPADKPSYAAINDSSLDEIVRRGDFDNIDQNFTIPSGGTETISLYLYQGSTQVDYRRDHWLIVTLIYDDGRQITYFVQQDP